MLVSATERETTRVLIERIAGRLEARWDEAATVPTYALEESGEAVEESEPGVSVEEASLTTLAELVGDGKRRRPAARGSR